MTWLQFKLKSLLILVLIVALPCSWLAWKMDRKRRERAAVAEIKKLGGFVVYDWFPQDGPPGPRWVRRLLGDDFFARIVQVGFVKSTNFGLVHVHLEELTGVEGITIP